MTFLSTGAVPQGRKLVFDIYPYPYPYPHNHVASLISIRTVADLGMVSRLHRVCQQCHFLGKAS